MEAECMLRTDKPFPKEETLSGSQYDNPELNEVLHTGFYFIFSGFTADVGGFPQSEFGFQTPCLP